jgi:phosphotransferase system HPr (HPr) family protein
MIIEKALVSNRLGLHARAASKLVRVAQQFAAEITVVRDAQTANGKSVLSVMMLEATEGCHLSIQADGEDEREAMSAMIELITDRFGESE